MLKTIQLTRNNAEMLYTILELKANDVERFIQNNRYADQHGDLAEAVRTADIAYLRDIRATQDTINKAIGE